MNSKTIIDFFKVQSTNVSCPACGLSLPKCKLNFHLDSDCPSSSSSHKEKDGISSEISPCSSKTSKPVNIKLKSKKSSKSPRTSKRSPKMNKLGRLSLKQQRIKNSNKTTSVIDSLKCLKETEIITLDEDSSSSVDNVTEKLQIRNINVSFGLEQTNVKSTSAVTVHKESSSCTEASAKLSNVAEITNSHQSVYQKEIEEKESSNGSKNPTGIAHDIAETNNLHQSMYQKEVEEKVSSNGSKNSTGIAHDIAETNNLHQSVCQKEVEEKASLNRSNTSVEVTHDVTKSIVNDICNKSGIENESKSKPVCDVSIAISQNNADELQSLGETNIDIDVKNVLKDAEDCLEADDNVFTQNSETSEQTEKYSPYYIANFKHILNTVLNDDYNKVLFNEEDMDYVKAFETSSEAAQKLYVRLFQRKYKWLRLSKISYPNITQDPEKPLNELVSAGLIDLGLDKIDLDTALNLLSFPEAKMVAKHFKLSGKNKADINQMLLKHCKQHRSVFFCNGKNTISNMVLKKIKDVLGPCYRLSLLPKRLFTRILMLFSLPTMSEDDDDAAGGQQQQLLTLLQVNKGEIIFPNYKINRQLRIFVERDELIRYEEAKQLENDIMNAVETKNFELAKELYLNARDEFDDQLLQPFVERPASLPTFLKKYSSFHIYVRCMTAGVDILQRLRQYNEAVELLKRLLDQKVFCQDYRGRWWDRMALNLEQHLKQPQQALEAIKEVIKDKNVRVGYRYSLLTRALRILKSVDEKDELKKEILEAVNVFEAPKVVIRGRLFPRNILGRRHVFISSSNVTDEDDITVLGVEQLAIEHYKNEGFTEGIHGEGSTFHALYGLLFWDIIYDGDIPDAFISPYQTHPLDLNHESFFIRREQQILNHLETLRASSVEEIKDIVKTSWEAHFGQTSLVAWDHFTDVEHILGLVACMGNNLLCGICERLARDFRFTRSGVPDLVVWNPETLQVKIVEVKGPGDKLSSKQILWLDYLLKLGAQAEVCLVEAVGSKKLRRE